MDSTVRTGGTFVFGSFRLDPVSRTLHHESVRVPMAARLFDTLLCLVANHDRLVERDELLRTVWPGRIVDQASAGRAISSVREVLKAHGGAETMITTAPGRGYRFSARVMFEVWEPSAPAVDEPSPKLVPALNHRVRTIVVIACVFFLAVAAASYAWKATSTNGPPAAEDGSFFPPAQTVAVLPFSNLTGDAAQDNFADGLAEELIDELGSVSALHVAASMSSFSFKGRHVAIPDIARQLHVGAVLDGSIRREGRRLRVDVALVDGRTGYQIWSRVYDRDPGDALPLEGRIAEAVMASLKVALLGGETARLRLGDTANGEAFDAYLAGVIQVSENDHASDRRAIEQLSRAIALDPNYALAYAQRARATTYITSDGEFPDAGTTRSMFASASG